MITAYIVLGILLFPVFPRIVLAKVKDQSPYDTDLTDYLMSMLVGGAMTLIWPFSLFLLVAIGGFNYIERPIKWLLEKTLFRGL